MKSEVMAEFGKKRIIDHDFPPPNKYVGSENNKEYAIFLAFGLNPTLILDGCCRGSSFTRSCSLGVRRLTLGST